MLAKAGWGGGNPETIANMQVDQVVKMYYYEISCNDYVAALHALNDPKST
tara:strand:- start:11317 stop:11466 length:150 start_codon:yes stop_codon:yes gene_type:complete